MAVFQTAGAGGNPAWRTILTTTKEVNHETQQTDKLRDDFCDLSRYWFS